MKVKKKDTILVVGLGSVGFLTAYFFKLRGFKNIKVTDINLNKRKYNNKLNLFDIYLNIYLGRS